MTEPPTEARPPLPVFLAGVAADPSRWAESLHNDQLGRWQQGERVRVEDYLAHLPGLASATEVVHDLIYGEVLLREGCGERPEPQEYQQRFPAHADFIERQFAVHRALGATGESEGLFGSSTPSWARRGDTPSAAASATPSVAEPAGLPTIPGYEVLAAIGRGGLGVVYKARQVGLNRLVAVKMIKPWAHAGPRQLARFRTEAEAVARLQHPNIVQIHEVGTWQGRPFFSMELVAGGSLAARMDGTAQPIRSAVCLVETLARTMHYAHRLGVVHRDLKPGNILLASGGCQPPDGSPSQRHGQPAGGLPPPLADLVPKVADFGLVKLLDDLTGQTRTGELIGTPRYMAPEQALGLHQQAGPWSDVYGLGVILYELLTGRLPFQSSQPVELLREVTEQPPPPPGRWRRLPADLEAICLKCLEKEPTRRYVTAEGLAEDLRRFQAGEVVVARPVHSGERLWKWARRQSRLGVLSGVLTLALLVLAGVAAVLWPRAGGPAASTGPGVAASPPGPAPSRRKEPTRTIPTSPTPPDTRPVVPPPQLAYGDLLKEAQHDIHEGRLSKAWELLQSVPPDVRGWEWHYLWHRTGWYIFGRGAGPAVSVAARPNGKLVASANARPGAAGKPAVFVWYSSGPKRGQLAASLAGHTCVAFSPDGAYLAAPAGERDVKVWHLTGEGPTGEVLTLEGHRAPVNTVAFSPDSARLVSGGDDGAILLWELPKSGGGMLKPTGRKQLDASTAVVSLAFSGDGRLLAFAGGNQFGVWETGTWKAVPRLTKADPAGRPVRCVTFHPKRPHLAVALGKSVRIWDTAERKELPALGERDADVRAVAYNHNGSRLAVVDERGTALDYPYVGDQTARPGRPEQPDFLSGFRAVAFTPGGGLMAPQEADGVCVWASNTAPFQRIDSHPSPVLALSFAREVTQFRSLHADRTILFYHWDREQWRRKSDKPVQLQTPEGWQLERADFSPDGSHVAARGTDGTFRVFDARTGAILATPKEMATGAVLVTLSEKGRWLTAVAPDGKWTIWDVSGIQKPRPVEHLPASPPGGYRSVRCMTLFAPNGPLALGYPSGQVLVWRGDNPKPPPKEFEHGKGVSVNAMAFIPGAPGSRLFTAGSDGYINIWNREERKLVFQLRAHHNWSCTCLAFSPNARWLASGGTDSAIRFWDRGGEGD